MSEVSKDFVFVLEQKAKKSGGDKYKCEVDDNFCIYFPQEISRSSGQPAKKLVVKISKLE